ncbi:MAG: zinc ribbon domain-containing protein [Nitriliruptorales bacterium]|nr:zinc ribbon domain-containing protein [Nitriliruptorales bacterium]
MAGTCEDCGAPVEDEWQFCRSCGAELEGDPGGSPAESDTHDTEAKTTSTRIRSVPDGDDGAISDEEAADRRKVTISLLIAMVVLVVLLAGALYGLDLLAR